jgi:hypothetical protein
MSVTCSTEYFTQEWADNVLHMISAKDIETVELGCSILSNQLCEEWVDYNRVYPLIRNIVHEYYKCRIDSLEGILLKALTMVSAKYKVDILEMLSHEGRTR